MASHLERGIFDAAVVGAGPAGSAVARWLALRGWRVALLERTRFEARRVGESFAPDVQEPLRELGLWSEFLALAPLPSWGTYSVWGDAEPRSHSHLHSPYGCGWHVDRRAFDQMLAHAAAAAGASLLEGVAVQRSAHREGCWWLHAKSIAPQHDVAGQTFRARVLIDASGRRSQIARARGAQRMLFDRLVGVAAHFAGVDSGEQGHLLVESAPEGWWYSAPLPTNPRRDADAQHGAGTMIAMLMTDADLCSRLRITVAERWQAVLRSTCATRKRLGSAQRVSGPKVHCAHSQRLRRNTASYPGPWLAVGDATLAVDPISGSGVLRALQIARAAADTVTEVLVRSSAWQQAIAIYETARDKECTAYLLERAQYYSAEQRFDSSFWKRRRRNETQTALA